MIGSRGVARRCVRPGRRSAVAALLLAACTAVPADPPAPAATPNYPKVNLSVAYAVDPRWPARPATCAWDHVPGIAVDGRDQVWVFTRAVPPVQVYRADGAFVRAWGDDSIRRAHYLRIGPDGSVWLADIDAHVVRKCTPEGRVLLTLGTFGEAGEDASHFNRPTDMAVAPEGDVYVSDGYGNNRVVHFDREGRFVKAWGRLGTSPGEFSLPHSIVRDSKGRLYVADRNNVRIQVFAPDGTFVAEWRNLLVPWGLCLTAADEIWACGSSPMVWGEGAMLGMPPKDQVLMKFNTTGRLLQHWTVPKGADGLEQPGECNWVHAIAEDASGNLYVGDIKGKRAQKLVRIK